MARERLFNFTCNITTSKLDKKTHINDKLINYSIEVETASNYINTIR